MKEAQDGEGQGEWHGLAEGVFQFQYLRGLSHISTRNHPKLEAIKKTIAPCVRYSYLLMYFIKQSKAKLTFNTLV